MRILYLLLFILAMQPSLNAQSEPFIRVEGKHLIKNGQPYYFIGANFWFGMSLGSKGDGGDRDRLIRELDRLQALGIDNLRIMAASEGPKKAPYRVQPALQNRPGKLDKHLLEGLDFLLVEMNKRNMHAVLVLNDFFQWSGGMAQYVSWATGRDIPYPHDKGHTWNEFQNFSAEFFTNPKAQGIFNNFIKKLLSRQNSISKINYTDDPTIMAWQLANEPRGFSVVDEYITWVDQTAGFIKSLDANHLVSLGGEGKTSWEGTGTAFERVSQSKNLDYLTAHLWIENWSWYQPTKTKTFESALKKATAYLQDHVAIAEKLNKPLVLEEFGISRDGLDYQPTAGVVYRDQYFDIIFDEVYQYASNHLALAGCNFWSWSGEGKPVAPGEFWKKGDPFTGDPPHESQGWYSIYENDLSTLKIIAKHVAEIKALNNNSIKTTH